MQVEESLEGKDVSLGEAVHHHNFSWDHISSYLNHPEEKRYLFP